MKIGIIGYGVVGEAIDYTLKNFYKIEKYDKFFDCGKIEYIIDTDMVFISVPTPYIESNKKMDLNSVSETLDFLSEKNYKGIVIIKSTLPLGAFDKFAEAYNLHLCLNPEFLRESKSPREDFASQEIIVIGAKEKEIFTQVKNMYVNIFPKSKYFFVSGVEAEIIKLSQNATLASRVAIANIVYDVCTKYNVEYDSVREIGFAPFEVLGPHMVEVPGPDGKRGFGGKCLPKDLLTFNSAIDSAILSEIIKYNKKLRKDL